MDNRLRAAPNSTNPTALATPMSKLFAPMQLTGSPPLKLQLKLQLTLTCKQKRLLLLLPLLQTMKLRQLGSLRCD